MKEEHKSLIEHIISEFKNSKDGVIHRSDLQEIFSDIDDTTSSSVWNLIIQNLKLVESVVNEKYNFTLTKKGWDFTSFKDIEISELALKEREQLEVDLAKSNLEANKLNKKIAKHNTENEKQNEITTWINIGIGIINIGLLIWQIIKADK